MRRVILSLPDTLTPIPLLLLLCRYTRMVAKRPHMMDHLTINISG